MNSSSVQGDQRAHRSLVSRQEANQLKWNLQQRNLDAMKEAGPGQLWAHHAMDFLDAAAQARLHGARRGMPDGQRAASYGRGCNLTSFHFWEAQNFTNGDALVLPVARSITVLPGGATAAIPSCQALGTPVILPG